MYLYPTYSISSLPLSLSLSLSVASLRPKLDDVSTCLYIIVAHVYTVLQDWKEVSINLRSSILAAALRNR